VGALASITSNRWTSACAAGRVPRREDAVEQYLGPCVRQRSRSKEMISRTAATVEQCLRSLAPKSLLQRRALCGDAVRDGHARRSFAARPLSPWCQGMSDLADMLAAPGVEPNGDRAESTRTLRPASAVPDYPAPLKTGRDA